MSQDTHTLLKLDHGDNEIQDLYAWILIDEDGEEDTFTCCPRNGSFDVQMIGGLSRMKDMRPYAKHMGKTTDSAVELIRFTRQETFGRIERPSNPFKVKFGGYIGKDGIVKEHLEEENEVWPDPTLEMLADPLFSTIWNVIRTWDIGISHIYAGCCSATGNHARAIYDALPQNDNRMATLKEEIGTLKSEIASEREAHHKCTNALRQKDETMTILFDRLRAAGVDCSDLIP